MKKLTAEEKKFVKKVADDNMNQTLNIDELREAFRLIGDKDQANIRQIRKALYDYYQNHNNEIGDDQQLPDHLNPDFDITQPLPEIVKPILNKEEKPSSLPKIEEQTVVDKRSKAYRDFKKGLNKTEN